MTRIPEYIVSFLLVLAAFSSSTNYGFPRVLISNWELVTLLTAFAGFSISLMRVNIFLKIIPIYTFITCFLSILPTVSWAAYWQIIVCCYFYILCLKIKDWSVVYRAIGIAMTVNLVMLSVQYLGIDSLLNQQYIGQRPYWLGIIGHPMQLVTYAVCWTSIMAQFHPIHFIVPVVLALTHKSAWGLLSTMVGLVFFMTHKKKEILAICGILFLSVFFVFAESNNKFSHNLNNVDGRRVVWTKTLEYANKKPWFGYGIGTYKAMAGVVFPEHDHRSHDRWVNVHNAYIQAMFETGVVGLSIIIWLVIITLINLISIGAYKLAGGLSMISLLAVCHFPDRMVSCVPLMLAFLAMYEQRIRRSI